MPDGPSIIGLLLDVHIWISFLSLVILEVVLGVDNLVFVAIYTNKLPEEQREYARSLGIMGALLMRIGLLFGIAWIVHLTDPVFTVPAIDFLFSIPEQSFSYRDLIMFFGGLFLVFKATVEIHEHVDTDDDDEEEDDKPSWIVNLARNVGLNYFGIVVIQILILDAVFSIDSIITAAGMVDNLYVMIAAVITAVTLLLVASGPLSAFVAKHQSVVMLALSFLLMIGTSLVAEGLHFHIPKGYIYAMMGFAILVEALNMMSRKARIRKMLRVRPPRRPKLANI